MRTLSEVVRIDNNYIIYNIRDCGSNLYVGMKVVEMFDSTIGKGEKTCGLWV